MAKNNDFLYLANLLMAIDDDGIVPELVNLLGGDLFYKLVDYYSGKYIYIPTREKIEKMAIILTYFIQTELKGVDEDKVVKELGLTNYQKRGMKKVISRFTKKYDIKEIRNMLGEVKNEQS